LPTRHIRPRSGRKTGLRFCPGRASKRGRRELWGSASRQDDKLSTACYQPAMEWIIAIALAVGAFVLVAVLALRIKRHDAGNVPGRFDFDRYKETELTRRGVFDKTKWR